MISQPILYTARQYRASGRADYTLWYGETRAISEKAINLVIVEAKKEGMVSAREAQLLGYMGIVHQERKSLGKVNKVVYGMASDGEEFRFFQVNNDSEWTTVSHRTFGKNYGKVVDILTYIIQDAISLSPFVSKNVTAGNN
ncbi:Restriction endonuclease type I HsdR N-terminal [Penicillium expansum]|nr:Restriction endonuclease type I HsdR N-terminal [Penicillium expansum]